MTARHPGPEDAENPDYDALFADIVSRWDAPPAERGTPADTGPDRPQDGETVEGPRGGIAAGPTAGPTGPAGRDDTGASPEPGPAEPAPSAESRSRWAPPPDRTPPEPTPPDRTPLDPAALAWGAGTTGGPTGWRVHVPPPDDDDEHYTPPPPAPLPTGDPTFWGALIGLVAGPIWLVYLVVAAPYGPKPAFVAAVVLTIGGFALLVSRLPRRRSTEDDDSDDGAVV